MQVERNILLGLLAAAVMLPFVITDMIRLVILILFPLLATWLPQRMIG